MATHRNNCVGSLENPHLNQVQVAIINILVKGPKNLYEIARELNLTYGKVRSCVTNPYWNDEFMKKRIKRPGLVELGFVEVFKDPRFHSKLLMYKLKGTSSKLKYNLTPLQERIVYALHEFLDLASESGNQEESWVGVRELRDYLNIEFGIWKDLGTLRFALDNPDKQKYPQYKFHDGLIQLGFVCKKEVANRKLLYRLKYRREL